MAAPTNTFTSYDAAGNQEDFHDAIYDISPTDTPFITLAKRLKADNRVHQWQTDHLAAHTAGNATIEGDDTAADASVATINLKNHCQLMDKVASVSNTQEAIKHYGRDSEMAYQMAKRAKELKRDLEAACVQNNAATAGVAASAAVMASLESWLAYSGGQASSIRTANGTSVQEGTGGTTPGFTTANGVPLTAPTDSTSTGSISETVLKNAIANTYEAGGDASVIMAGPRVKAKVAGFAGHATRFREVPSSRQAQIIGGADLYVSDFGEHRLVPNRFMRGTVLFGIDPEYVGVAYLQPFRQKDLSVTGHAQRKIIWTQATLVVQNPWAHFKIADINSAK